MNSSFIILWSLLSLYLPRSLIMKNFKSDHIYRKIYSLEITQSIYKPDSFFVGSSIPRLFPSRVFPSLFFLHQVSLLRAISRLIIPHQVFARWILPWVFLLKLFSSRQGKSQEWINRLKRKLLIAKKITICMYIFEYIY